MIDSNPTGNRTRNWLSCNCLHFSVLPTVRLTSAEEISVIEVVCSNMLGVLAIQFLDGTLSVVCNCCVSSFNLH